jgi:hypothetical protein
VSPFDARFQVACAQLTQAPEALAAAMRALARSEDFAPL